MEGCLYGSKVYLRVLSAADIELYLQRMVPLVQQLLHVSSLDMEYIYLHEQLAAMREGRTFFYCIYDRFLATLIGAIEIRNRQQYPGQLYTWLHPSSWAHGYFQEALYLASRTYFCCTLEPYITARVDRQNKRSRRALKRVGFADYRMVDGGYAPQYELVLINKW